MMRIILTGGGTGGHVTPAIAIGEELRSEYPSSEILFIGRRGGKENEAVTAAGIHLETVEIRGLERRLSTDNFKAAVMAVKAYKRSKEIIKEFRPDVIVGTGGYVSWPVVRAGQTLGIATVIHESNVYPGLVTRLLAKRCDKVLLNNSKAAEALRCADTLTVGNPIRTDFSRISREEARRKLGARQSDTVIVSFGGSGGAEMMNDVVTEVMRKYTATKQSILHIHATGRAYYEKYSGRIATSDTKSRIMPFIHNMPEMLRAADIAITRCGALTLSELCYVGLPAILIPSPNVTDDHQRKNGEVIAKEGGAVMIEEKDLDTQRLLREIVRLERDKALRNQMSKCIEKFANFTARKDCCNAIADAIRNHSAKKKRYNSP